MSKLEEQFVILQLMYGLVVILREGTLSFWNNPSKTFNGHVKIAFNGHVYFEPVCTQKVLDALVYLKSNNNFYSNIRINMEHLPPELCDLDEYE